MSNPENQQQATELTDDDRLRYESDPKAIAWAREVVAVADAELAGLRAEVERLRAAIGDVGQGYHSDTCRTNYAPQGPCNCFQAELRAVLEEPQAPRSPESEAPGSDSHPTGTPESGEGRG